jgi:cation diffusion facilitator CzcD-associated flavoprotein CzcO
VLIVGGGQSGVFTAAWLQREGVGRVAVLDRAARGEEGPWRTYARMSELRTPKQTFGNEFGIPNLSLRHWYRARYGSAAWDAIERVPRIAWAAYIEWFATTVGVSIENGVEVTDIRPVDDGTIAVHTIVEGRQVTRHARAVVLATGFDGAGAWRVPAFIADSLPRDRYDHSNGPIDFTRFRSRRVGVLGHGASAFDNAICALQAGAASVELSFRRQKLPRTNPHRAIETAAMMTHFPALADETRWQIARYFRQNDQPPPVTSFKTACGLSGFGLRPATPWEAVAVAGDGTIMVRTPHGVLGYDHLILATGAVIDLSARPELATLRHRIALWGDQYEPPPAEVDARLSQLPYLDDGYGFRPKSPDDAWVARVFAFNSLSMVSHGPHSTSISGHRHGMPRLVRGITRRLLLDAEADIMSDLRAYRSDDLPIPDDFEARLIAHPTEIFNA